MKAAAILLMLSLGACGGSSVVVRSTSGGERDVDNAQRGATTPSAHIAPESPGDRAAPPDEVRSDNAVGGEPGGSELQRLAELARSQAAVSHEETESAWPKELGEFSRAEVLRTLGATESESAVLRVRSGKFGGDSLAILTFHVPSEAADGVDALEPRLFVVSTQNGLLKRIAEGRIHFPEDACKNADGASTLPERELFVASVDYMLGHAKHAIGVVLTCSISGPSWSGQEKYLVLLELKASRLMQVLDLRTEHDVFDRVADANVIEHASVVVDEQHLQNGYFDLKVRSTRQQRVMRNGIEQAEQASSAERRMRRRGYRYQTLPVGQ